MYQVIPVTQKPSDLIKEKMCLLYARGRDEKSFFLNYVVSESLFRIWKSLHNEFKGG